VGHENWIDVYSFSHGITTPTGPNGLPTGPPQTSPLYLMAGLDRATMKLFTMASTQETFADLKLELTEPNQQGQSVTTYRVQLVDALLTDIQQAASGSDVSYSLSFTYSRVHITDVVLGTTVSFDWYTASAVAPQPLAKGILLPPAPNPTQGRAEFRFSLPADSNAELALFDLRGRLVRQLHNGWTSVEPVVAVWDGTDDQGVEVAQGMYVARLTYPGRVATQRIAVVR
jgi:type VI secretion system Hcp family effector